MYSMLGNCLGGEGLDFKFLNFFLSCVLFGLNMLFDKLIFLVLLFCGLELLKFVELFFIDFKLVLILIDGLDYFVVFG